MDYQGESSSRSYITSAFVGCCFANQHDGLMALRIVNSMNANLGKSTSIHLSSFSLKPRKNAANIAEQYFAKIYLKHRRGKSPRNPKISTTIYVI